MYEKFKAVSKTKTFKFALLGVVVVALITAAWRYGFNLPLVG